MRTARFALAVAENLANRLIGLLVTVGILAAIYFFAIKPILDTTNNAIDRAFEPLEGLNVQGLFDDAGFDEFTIEDVQSSNFPDVRQQIQSSGLSGAEARRAQRLLACIQRVQPDTAKMQVCSAKYQS